MKVKYETPCGGYVIGEAFLTDATIERVHDEVTFVPPARGGVQPRVVVVVTSSEAMVPVGLVIDSLEDDEPIRTLGELLLRPGWSEVK